MTAGLGHTNETPADAPDVGRILVIGIIALAVAATPAIAMQPNGGYYEGLSMLYPYSPVFCDEDSGMGSPCFGMPGSHLFLPKSAPLPPGHEHCRWADDNVTLTEGWYQWEPRIIELYKQSAKVCYFEDRGEAHNISSLTRKN